MISNMKTTLLLFLTYGLITTMNPCMGMNQSMTHTGNNDNKHIKEMNNNINNRGNMNHVYNNNIRHNIQESASYNCLQMQQKIKQVNDEINAQYSLNNQDMSKHNINNINNNINNNMNNNISTSTKKNSEQTNNSGLLTEKEKTKLNALNGPDKQQYLAYLVRNVSWQRKPGNIDKIKIAILPCRNTPSKPKEENLEENNLSSSKSGTRNQASQNLDQSKNKEENNIEKDSEN